MDFKQMFIENFNEEKYNQLEKSFENPSYRGLRINYNKPIMLLFLQHLFISTQWVDNSKCLLIDL